MSEHFNLIMAGDKIASSSSADARWHARLAALLAASGRHESAASHFRRALQGLQQDGARPEEDAQKRLQWQFELAAVETKRGRRQAAIGLYEEVLQADPECVEALINLAAQLAIADATRLQDALQLCEQALALRPDFAEAHYNRNMLLRRLGRQQEAVAMYWECLARDLGADTIRETMPDELARAVLPVDGQSREGAGKPSVVPIEDTTCNQASDGDGVTAVCVKWGTKYGPDYVNKLYNSVTRHCGELQVTFVCLTDNSNGVDLHDNLRVLPLPDGWKGWWNKCHLFSSEMSAKLRALGHSRCLYMDLDTVIVGSLVDLLAWTPPVGVLALLKTDEMANEQRAGGYNSSIMAWRNVSDEELGPLQFVYSFLHSHFTAVTKYIYKFDHWLEMAHPEACFLENTFPNQIVEYRSLDESAATPPPNASVVCFPLLPKPHGATSTWLAHHWV
ncbi:hypothetical protein PF008_g7049 [Phytophthora fragariae]|uniref:Uncharacterized protein n=1 Tax=Phytophthora fragariae TaxID=53985 RepID=A0A6G0S3U9_9STRA|nr:hypothetical protein PF008_g7049 [Phytophthora fragariae]